MIRIKHIFLFLLLSGCLLGSQAQNEAIIKKIHDRLTSYFEHQAVERICLITDKEVYKPGETIFFNALAGSLPVQGLHAAGSGLKVSVYNTEGQAIVEGDFEFSSGMASGSIRVPENSGEGRYVLEAHHASARNEDEACMKLIFIDPMNEAEVTFHLQKAPELLIAGEKHPVELVLNDLNGKAVSGEKLVYELRAGDDLLTSGKLKTDDQGTLRFDLDVPEGEYDRPVWLKVSNSGRLNYSHCFHVNTGKLKVCFYAEGGRFLAGVPLKTGFRVTTSDGRPVDISAEITGEDGRPVSQAKTLIPGYGMFPVTANTDEKYRFLITSELGKGQSFDLPAFEQEGFTFGIPRTDQEFIHVNLLSTNTQTQEVNLLVTRGDRLFWASTADIRGTGRLKIPKQDLPPGLCLLSAFSERGELLGERMLYVSRDPQLQFSAEVTQDGSDRSGTLLIKAVPSAKADSAMVTVSVSAAVKSLEAGDDFLTCFTLNSLLENRISGATAMKKEGILNENIMNYLLIANRFRNYSWQSVLDFETAGGVSPSEKSWLSGRILDRSGDAVQNAKVSLFHHAQMMNVTTDEEGHFIFPGISPAKKDDHVLKAIAPDGNDKLTIEFDKDPGERLSMQVQRFLSCMAGLEKPGVPPQFVAGNQFLYTRLKRKPVPAQDKNASYLKQLQSGSTIMDVIKMIKPYHLVDGDKIVFPGGSNSLMAQDGALIVLDGQKMGTSASAINNISPYDVASIEISTNPVDISRYTGLNSVGLIEINTRRGEPAGKPTDTAEDADSTEFRGDQRQTTLYWSPALLLNEEGEVRIQIPATRIKGDFVVEVNGMDKKGRLGQHTLVLKSE